MKRQLILLFLLGWVGVVWGQQSIINESRILINPIALKQDTLGAAISIGKGAKFTILEQMGDNYKIYFWNWKDTTIQGENKYKKYNYDEAKDSQRYFLISSSILDVYSKKIYDMFAASWGTLTYPFKWRPNDGTFESTFALNMAGGVKWNPFRTNKHIFSGLIGVGPSTVHLDKYNTNPNTPLEEKIIAPAVTFSVNLMYQYDFVQFGLSGGWDSIFDNHLYRWKNQGNMWLSIGVGISIFKDNERTATPASN